MLTRLGKTMRKFLLAVLLTAACSSDPTVPMTGVDEPGRASVDFGVSPGQFALDPYQIETARIFADTMRVTVTHGGGCRKHEYGLIAYSGWMESNPVQVRMAILHDAHGDNCKALLRSDLRFDMVPLREAYKKAYGGMTGTIIINLANPAALSGPELFRLTYTF
jgi:hypothetical protein